MAITKQKKSEIFAKLTDLVKTNPSVLFVNFHKLTVGEATKVRRALRASGVGYFVAKKTLIKKALTEAKIPGEMPALDGEIAVAYSTDLIAPAREIYTFQKSLENRVSIVGGVFEGSFKGKADMLAIATIPSRNVLYAQFANLINSPIQRLVIGLNQIALAKEKAN